MTLKMSKVLDDLIVPNQKVYVDGRLVTDNLRSILFMGDQCMEKEVDAVLTSLDAKKAFDSKVTCTLKPHLRSMASPHNSLLFQDLVLQISVEILINGQLSDSIDIKRGYKLVML
jgi:hypothetical protein